MRENESRQHWLLSVIIAIKDDLVKARERVGLQSNFPEQVRRQMKTSSSQSSGGLFLHYFAYNIAKPCKYFFHCLPSYWLKEILGLSSGHSQLLAVMMNQNYVFIKQ